MKRTYTLVIAVLVIGSLIGGAVQPTAAAEQPTEQIVVTLSEDGTATLSMTYTYALDSDTEAAAFSDLQQNATVKQNFKDRFTARMERVASAMSEETNRNISVTDSTITLEKIDNTGYVTLSVELTNFAATEDSQLVLTEPFSSGFDTEKPVNVVLPDGYTVASTAVEPTTQSDQRLTWNASTTFTGFELVISEPETKQVASTPEETSKTNLPGFGVVATFGALLMAIGVLARRT